MGLAQQLLRTTPKPAGMDAAPHHGQVGHKGDSANEEEGRQLIRRLRRRREYLHKRTTTTQTYQSSTVPPTFKNSKSYESKEKQQCTTDPKYQRIQEEEEQLRGPENAQKITKEPQLYQVSRHRDRRPFNHLPHLRVRGWGSHTRSQKGKRR